MTSIYLSKWTIIPLASPQVWRRCPGCYGQRAFVSSDRFRINAHKSRIDVWLIYRCCCCESTWNRPIYERIRVADIGAAQYQRMMANDRGVAWACAFDLDGLRRLGVRVDANVPVKVINTDAVSAAAIKITLRDSATLGSSAVSRRAIYMQLAHPCEIRLDRLLAAELGLSRNTIVRRVRNGSILITPDTSAPLRKSVRTGQVVWLNNEP